MMRDEKLSLPLKQDPKLATYLDAATDTQFIDQVGNELARYSNYYPRNKSPEAAALERGLLQISGDELIIRSLLNRYVKIEEEACLTNRSGATGQLAAASQSDLANDSFFSRLGSLKVDLIKAASSSESLTVLQRLLHTYLESGSDALGYFAALDCIAGGDRSHSTLFIAFEKAKNLGILSELSEYLKSLNLSDPQATVHFHAFRIAQHLAIDEVPEECSLKTLKALYPNTPEGLLGGAIDSYARKLFSTAENQALQAYLNAKCHDPQLRIEALYLVIRAYLQQDVVHSPEKKDLAINMAKKILALNPEDPLAWELMLRKPLGSANGAQANWSEVKELLTATPSACGYLLAGTRAQELKDSARAKQYFEQALSNEKRGVESLIALADLSNAEDDFNRAKDYLAQAAERSPHHSNVKFFNVPTAEEALRAEHLPPQEPLKPGDWCDKIRTQIETAHRNKSQSIKIALQKSCSEYLDVVALLANGSDLFANQDLAIRQLKGHLAQVRPLLKMPVISNTEWVYAASAIYKATDPNGFSHPVAHFAGYLKQLSGALHSLDPGNNYFESLQQHQTVWNHAKYVRESWYKCANLFTQGRSVQETCPALKLFIATLETFETALVNEVGPKLLQGSNLLKAWTIQVERLNIDTGEGAAKDAH